MKKRYIYTITANLLLLPVLTGAKEVLAVTAVAPSTEVILPNTTVTAPANLLTSAYGESNVSQFVGWETYYEDNKGNVELKTAMSKNQNGYFILNETLGAVSNGVKSQKVNGKSGASFWHHLNGGRNPKAWLSQKIQVVKGETYQLKFHYSGSIIGATANNIFKIGDDSIAFRESAATGSGYQTMNYTAAYSGEIEVAVGTGIRSIAGLLGNDVESTISDVSVVNVDVTPPEKPTVHPIYTDANLVTGQSVPFGKVYAKTEDEAVYAGDVSEDGSFSIQLPRQVVGNYVLVYAQDVAGNTSDVSEYIVRQGALAKPEIDAVTNESTRVTGNADLSVNVQVKIIKPDLSEKIYTGHTDETGKFAIAVATPAYGDNVQVSTSAPGKTSEVAEVAVTDVIKPSAPEVADLYTDSIEIKGIGDKDNRVRIELPDGSIHEEEIDHDGSFVFPIAPQEEGAIIKISQVKPSGLVGDDTQKTILPGKLPQPKVDELTDQTTLITGVGTPNASLVIAIKNVSGEIIKEYTGTIDSAGKFQLMTDKLEADNTVVVYTHTNEQSSQEVVLPVKDVTAPEKPAIDPVKESSTVITGKTEKHAIVTVTLASGETLVKGKADESGSFFLTIDRQALGTELNVRVSDKAGNESEAVVIIVEESQGKITAADYVLGDIMINGTYTGDVAKARLTVNNKVLSWGGSFEKGSFTYYVGSGRIKQGDSVTLTAFSAADKKLSEQKISLISSSQKGDIFPHDYELEDMVITGTYTGSVEKAKLVVNGKTISWGGTFADGQFSYYVGAGKIKAGDHVELIGYTRFDEALSAKEVVLASRIELGSAALAPYTLGDVYVTGSYTGDVVKAQLSIDGTLISLGGTFKDGQFTYYVGNKLQNAGEAALTFYSSLDEQVASEKITIAVPESSGTVKPDNYVLGSLEITGSYTGDVKKARVIIDGVPQAWGGDFKDGRFSYYIGHKIQAGSQVEINVYDQFDKVLDTTAVEVVDRVSAGTIAVDTFQIGNVNVTGTYTGDVTIAKLVVNDVTVSWGGTFTDGKFIYYCGNKIKPGDKVQLIAYDTSLIPLDEQMVVVLAAEE